MPPNLAKLPLYLTAALRRRSIPPASPFILPSSASRFISSADSSAANNSPATPSSELTRLPSILEGCDYEHWLVFMESPKDYPTRNEIINRYVSTLAMAFDSEEEAKKSIYSVSTKYCYAFGCNVPRYLTYKIKSLPDVRWVLPDSYLCYGEKSYGGEPFIDGKVAPYDDKYHKDWIRYPNPIGDKIMIMTTTPVKKARKRRKKSSSVNSGEEHVVSQ